MITENRSVENCNLCGACNLSCPIYKVLLKESGGARFKAFLAKKNDIRQVFYLCTECDACVRDCPARIDIRCLTIRKRLVEAGMIPPANKLMRDNILAFGNPFGEIKKDKKIDKYYT